MVFVASPCQNHNVGPWDFGTKPRHLEQRILCLLENNLMCYRALGDRTAGHTSGPAQDELDSVTPISCKVGAQK